MRRYHAVIAANVPDGRYMNLGHQAAKEIPLALFHGTSLDCLLDANSAVSQDVHYEKEPVHDVQVRVKSSEHVFRTVVCGFVPLR